MGASGADVTRATRERAPAGRSGPAGLRGGMPSGARRWLLARALASVGAALFVVGAWAPWLYLTLDFSGGRNPENATFSSVFNGGYGLLDFLQLVGVVGLSLPTTLLYLLGFTWGAVTLLGVLLCPLLWLRLGPRAARLAVTAYAAWGLLATITATVAANALARNALVRHAPGGATVVSWRIGWGFWLAALGLLLAWAAASALLGEARRAADLGRPMAGTAAPRALLQFAGAGLISGGALAWGLGFLALPWATTNCSGLTLSLNHYTRGPCAALDAADALSAALIANVHLTATTSPAEYALLAYGLLTGGALLVVAGAWRRASTWPLCAWLSAWFALADAAVIVALRGVVIIRRTAPILSTDSAGAWVVGPGVFVALAGLLLIAAGLAALWWRALHRPRQPIIEASR